MHASGRFLLLLSAATKEHAPAACQEGRKEAGQATYRGERYGAEDTARITLRYFNIHATCFVTAARSGPLCDRNTRHLGPFEPPARSGHRHAKRAGGQTQAAVHSSA